jgi:myo-inositol-1(or 4)-monophosphatase
LQTDKAEDTAKRAALKAGTHIRERLGHSKIDYKSAFNLVTDVDKASEKMILEILRADFPDDSILAEEGGGTQNQSSRRWLIDPLDGTTNFAHSYPFFAVSIALEVDGEVVVGVVFNPISQECFSAKKGKGAFLNDQPIKVSNVPVLNESLLATGFPADSSNSLQNNVTAFAEVTHRCHGVRRDGSAALDLCYVASGRLDGFWELKLAPWDIGAGSLIVREAGGMTTDVDGGPLKLNTGHILATNGKIHNEVIQVLESVWAKARSDKS